MRYVVIVVLTSWVASRPMTVLAIVTVILSQLKRPPDPDRRTDVKLSMPLIYAGNPREAADQVAGLEKAGLDTIWVAEPYGFDAPTLMGYLAAKTETVEIGAGILNIYSRTPGRPAADRGRPRQRVRRPRGARPRRLAARR